VLNALYVALVGVLVGGPNSYDTVGAQHFELELGVIGDRHESGIAWAPKDGVVCSTESDHFKKVRVSFLKLAGVPKQIGRSTRPTGSARFPGTTPWKPPTLGWRHVLVIPRRLRVWA
jgi:hypothetical protein